jgi:N-acetyl-anhydromuramyl-L-alanine amidase AmpD
MGMVGSDKVVEAQQASLESEFQAAAEESGVPKELLKAMGYVNTRWEMPPPKASDYEGSEPREGEPEARGDYGLMQLTQNPSKNTLGKAVELTDLSEGELKTSRPANVRGGATVLANIQGEEKPTGINGWYEAVAEYGDGALYANQVYETLKKGASTEISTGEKVKISAQPEAEPRVFFTTQAGADYGRATWYGTNGYNYTAASRGPAQINKVVVHVTQGSFSSAINWFRDSRAQSSAHYTVRSSDGFIGQSVREKNIAWHAGNWDYNKTSIGIEHEGYVSNASWFTDSMYRSSARLTAHLAKKYRIPIDRKHIIGHNQVPGATHTDPGGYWNWSKYMNYVRAYAGSGTKYKQIVDNSSRRFTASPAWRASSWSSQRYGKNYRYTKPKRTKDRARFKIKIPRTAKYKVYARWPANKGYNSRTRFRIKASSRWVTKVRNQRKNGGRWVYLGTYRIDKGDRYYVQIPRYSNRRGYVIADAVMVKRA